MISYSFWDAESKSVECQTGTLDHFEIIQDSHHELCKYPKMNPLMTFNMSMSDQSCEAQKLLSFELSHKSIA